MGDRSAPSDKALPQQQALEISSQRAVQRGREFTNMLTEGRNASLRRQRLCLEARVLERLKLCGAHVVAGRSLMESIARCTAVNIFPWVTVPETNSPSLRIVKLGLPTSVMMIPNV